MMSISSLTKAVRIGLLATTSVALLASAGVNAETQEKMERIEVTGSKIKRIVNFLQRL